MPSSKQEVKGGSITSPDGVRFAYLEARGGNPEVIRLCTVDTSGAEAIPLTDGRTKVWVPTWSPDGRWLVVVRQGRLFRT